MAYESLIQGPQGAISASAGSHVISCLDDWTVFGNCNWGERLKFNEVSAEYLNLMPLNSMKSSKKSSHNSSSSSGSGSDRGDDSRHKKAQTVLSHSKDASHPSQTEIEVEVEDGRERSFSILHVLEFWSSTYSYRLISSKHSPQSSTQRQKGKKHPLGNRRLIDCRDDLSFPAVEPHTATLYALRLTPHDSPPLYVGSNLHFTSGLEVTSFKYVLGPKRVLSPDNQSMEKQELSNSCTIRFEHCAVRCQQWTGYIWLYLPNRDTQPLASVSQNKGGTGVRGVGGRGKVPLPVLEGDLAGCGGPELVENIVGPHSRTRTRISRATDSCEGGSSSDSLIGNRSSGSESGSDDTYDGEEGDMEKLLGRVWRVPVATPGHDEDDELIVFW